MWFREPGAIRIPALGWQSQNQRRGSTSPPGWGEYERGSALVFRQAGEFRLIGGAYFFMLRLNTAIWPPWPNQHYGRSTLLSVI